MRYYEKSYTCPSCGYSYSSEEEILFDNSDFFCSPFIALALGKVDKNNEEPTYFNDGEHNVVLIMCPECGTVIGM